MNEINKNLKKDEDKKEFLKITGNNIEKIFTRKINLLSSNEINTFIKNLSRPQFLGSIHLSNDRASNYSAIGDLIKGELELKMAKTLKSPYLNPITRYLIYVMILFNLLWLIFFYIL